MRQVAFNKHNFTDYVVLSDTAGLPKTGLVAAGLTCSYVRNQGVRVSITLSDLAAVNSAYAVGGLKEVDAVNQPGLYRIDTPDAMWTYSTNVDKAYLSFKGAAIKAESKEYYLYGPGITEGSTTDTGSNPWTFSDGTIRADN